LIVRKAVVDDHEVAYTLCRVLPDTALVLRDTLREADRIWALHLGAELHAKLKESIDGQSFFTGRVRLEPVPPEREMVGVWLPLPPDFDTHVRPQLVDFIEAFEAARGMREPPEGWPGWHL